MRLFVISDIHGSALYCEKALEAFEREQADKILILGDILHHGPRNDLPEKYAPKEVIALLSPLKDNIFCVRGNCDTEVDQMVLPFPVLADYAVFNISNRLFYATHGHNFNMSSPPPLCKGDILLHGHTHIPAWKAFGNSNMYFNPGSVSIPKEDSPHSYMIITENTAEWKTLDGKIYHTELF